MSAFVPADMQLSTGLVGAGSSRSTFCIHLHDLGCGDASGDSMASGCRGMQNSDIDIEFTALFG